MSKLSLAQIAVLQKKHTENGGMLQTIPYLKDRVKNQRGGPVDPIEISKELKIAEPKARAKMLRVMRTNIREMIGRFVWQGKGMGAPKLEALRASAPLEVVIEAYESYQGKAIRMAKRWNGIAGECDAELRALRRKRRQN